MIQVRAVATADDSNQKDLDAEREMANWGATPEEEKFEATKLEALAHNAETFTRIPTAVNEEKIYHTLFQIKRAFAGSSVSPATVGPVHCDARWTCCTIIQVIGNEISDRQ
jgi:hypothetical protein